MILAWLIIIPLAGGLLAWAAGRRSPVAARWVALSAALAELAIACAMWACHAATMSSGAAAWPSPLDLPWIPQIGSRIFLAIDGLSLLFVLLTALVAVWSVLASWRAITVRVGLFHACLLWTIAGTMGIFLALDLLVFYFFWELMLVPLYFLIAIWGHERRTYAAVKFFLFTQGGGLLLLLGILGLYFAHWQATGVYTFNYSELLGTAMPASTAMWLMLGFFAAFAVKLPVFGVHTWLPDAHMQAPASGGVDLAGLVVKVGTYGLLRFVVPLFAPAAGDFAPVAMTLAVAGILYGALVAFAQSDLKRLVAYSSLSHMGFVLLGVFAWAASGPAGNELALQGVVIIVIAHGISTGALFVLVGVLHRRTGSRDVRSMGGLWAMLPRAGGVGMFLAIASLGLPALGNFVGEVLVLAGTYPVSPTFTVLAAGGMVLSVAYWLWMIQRVFQGPPAQSQAPGAIGKDLTRRESAILLSAVVLTLVIGLYPRSLIVTSASAIDGLQRAARDSSGGSLPSQDAMSAQDPPKGDRP